MFPLSPFLPAHVLIPSPSVVVEAGAVRVQANAANVDALDLALVSGCDARL